MSDPSPTPAEAVETHKAIRMVALISAIAVLAYLGLGLVIHDDATLTRYGRSEQIPTDDFAMGAQGLYYIPTKAKNYDRDALHGDRPMIWLMGNSIIRDATDAEELQRVLQDHGAPWGVEKFAFGRGTPVFSWAMLDLIDIRPGDRVITSVSYDNFLDNWLKAIGGLDTYIAYLLKPKHLWQLEALSAAEKSEFSLGSAPPREYHQTREQFREGLEMWVEYGTGRRDKRPIIKKHHRTETYSTRKQIPGFRKVRAFIRDKRVKLEPGQINYDGLRFWKEEVERRGAEAWILYIPPGPEYYERFVADELPHRFHRHMATNFQPFVFMEQQQQDWMLDYRHPNFLGREPITRELAKIMLLTPPGEAWVPREQDRPDAPIGKLLREESWGTRGRKKGTKKTADTP